MVLIECLSFLITILGGTGERRFLERHAETMGVAEEGKKGNF
jgi:hypothetical protein